MTNHPTDADIQQYVFDKNSIPPVIADHIAGCITCKEKAGSYGLLFSGINKIEKPFFEFDLTALVLSQLSPASKKRSVDLVSLFIIVFSIGFTCISAYLVSRYLAGFNNMMPYVLSLIIVSAAVITILQGIEMYRTFRVKMNKLDIY